MALWLIVNDDMYYQGIEQGDSMQEIAEKVDLKNATLIVRLDNETVETINMITDKQTKEQKTGHWISVNDEDVVAIDNDGFPERACFCSECKKYLIASDEYAVYGRYCPFCGAKMET